MEKAIGIASILSDAQEWLTRKDTARANDLINQAKQQLFESVDPAGLEAVVLSSLDADVHPWEWVSALLADYKTLAEKAAAVGIMTDDPESESQMLGHVGRFCASAAALSRRRDIVQGKRSE